MSTTPPYKRKLDDTDDDDKTPKKRGRKAAHDYKWDQNFDLLRSMKAQTGNFNFIRDNPALQGWVQYMKSSYKRGKLAPERVEALEQIGFAWTTYLTCFFFFPLNLCSVLLAFAHLLRYL